MLIRIVKMKFQKAKLQDFYHMFDQKKERIREQEGCLKLELLSDIKDETTIFTYSYWNSEEDLNRYRASDLFGKVWKETKSYFEDRPQAWSLEQQHKL